MGVVMLTSAFVLVWCGASVVVGCLGMTYALIASERKCWKCEQAIPRKRWRVRHNGGDGFNRDLPGMP